VLLESFDLVVVGGGIAGTIAAYTAASKAKKENKNFTVALISNENAVYARSALPSLIAKMVRSLEDIILYPTTELRSWGIKLYIPCEVHSADFEKQFILVENLKTAEKFEIGFKKLVIATGSVPEIPPIKGVNLKGVYTVKWFKDAEKLSRSLKPGMKALIVGPGLIGMAVADALLKRGLKVTVVARTRVLSNILEPALADYVREKAENAGLTVMTKSELQEIGGKGKVEFARINNEKANFDFVIFAVGVRPNTKIFWKTCLDLADYGAIKTDRQMQTNIEGIYAAGDCAEKLDLITGKPVHRPLGSLAAKTAEIAGLNAFGENSTFEGSIRHQHDYVFKTYISSTGLTSREASLLGVSTEILPVELSAVKSFPWEILKRPFEAKMCAIIEKGSEKIVGWQSVGSVKLTSIYDVCMDKLIRSGGKISDIQELGLKIS
jgi:NADPH-dependent 2,4-dienoyl-CoA reductase/sulfur reductase-like enzyme